MKEWHHMHFSASPCRRETHSLPIQPSEWKVPGLLSLRWAEVNGNPEFCEVTHCQGCSVQGSSALPCCFFYVMHRLFIPGWDFIAASCLIDVYLYCVENEANTYKNYLRELWWQIFTLRCLLCSWSSSSSIPTYCSDHVACVILAL